MNKGTTINVDTKAMTVATRGLVLKAAMLTSGNDRTTRSSDAQKTYFRNQNSFTLTSTRTSNAQIAKNARAVRPLYKRNRFIGITDRQNIGPPGGPVIIYHHGCLSSSSFIFLLGGAGYPWS